MNWILGLFFVLIVIFLMNNYFKKKRIAKLKIYFLENWGKPKNEGVLQLLCDWEVF